MNDRSTQGILLGGNVRSIDPQGLYFATALELAGKKKIELTLVSRTNPSTAGQRAYQVGDRVLLLGAIVADPPLDILGYEGTESMVIWSDPRLAASSRTEEPLPDPHAASSGAGEPMGDPSPPPQP